MGENNKRKPGRPPAAKRPIGPQELDIIAVGVLQHRPLAHIAKELGVSSRTVQHHLDTTIRPGWALTRAIQLQEELEKVALLERTAWDHFKKTGEYKVLENIRWAADYRAKVAGFHVQRHYVQQEAEIRIAGQTPADFDRHTVELILKEMGVRAEHQKALQARTGNGSGNGEGGEGVFD